MSHGDFRRGDMSFCVHWVMGTLVFPGWLSFPLGIDFRNVLCTHSKCDLDDDDDDDDGARNWMSEDPRAGPGSALTAMGSGPHILISYKSRSDRAMFLTGT